jgi:hypothetical protein
MGGIGLQIGVGADLKLEFSDADEIKEHPIASQFAEHTFDMFKNMTIGDDQISSDDFQFEMPDIDAEKI